MKTPKTTKNSPHPKNDQVEYLEHLMELQNNEIEMLQNERSQDRKWIVFLSLLSLASILFNYHLLSR